MTDQEVDQKIKDIDVCCAFSWALWYLRIADIGSFDAYYAITATRSIGHD